VPDLRALFARRSRRVVGLLLGLVFLHAAWDLWAPGPVWMRVALFSGAAAGIALFVQRQSRLLRDTLSRQLDRLAEQAERVERGEDSGERPTFAVPQVDRTERALANIAGLLQDHQQLRAQLQSLQRQQVAGILARELNIDLTNRLTVVLAQLDLAMDGLAEADPRKLHLRHAEDAAKACVQNAQSILTFASGDHSAPAVLDLNPLLERVRALLGKAAGNRIRIVLEPGTKVPLVLGSAAQLEQVVMNLGLNAKQAMQEGGTLTFRTGQSAEGSESLLDRIWQPFFSTRAAPDGVGLGLATAQEILREHHGRIEVESSPGQGSVFTVLLPPAPVQQVAPAGHRPPRPRLEGIRILLAEDEPEIRAVLKELLTRMGAEVVAGMDGEDAWNLWELLGPFDLLLTDQRMPRLNGLELLGRVRAARAGFPVLLMSGYGLEEAAAVLAGDPDSRLLAKPFTVPVLTESVAELVSRSRVGHDLPG
jgi:signal transduction histidine kinase/CheY-like chemotaxis protein